MDVLRRTPETKNGEDVICRGFAFSPDGNLIAGEWDDDVLLWDAQSGEVLRVFEGPPNRDDESAEIPRFAFDTDGKFLSCWWRGKQMQWEISSGRLVGKPESPEEWMAVSADKKVAVSVEEGQTVVLWDLPDKKRTGSWRAEKHGEDISDLALSSHGKKLAACNHGEGDVRIYDSASGLVIRTIPGKIPVTALFFKSDDRVLIVVRCHMYIEFWDLSNGRLIRINQQKFAFFDQALLNPDGLILATSSAETGVTLWSTGATPTKPGSWLARNWFQLAGRDLKWNCSGNPNHGFLGVSPHTHVGIVRVRKPRKEMTEALFWNYFGAENWNSAQLILDRLEPGEFKEEAELAISKARNLPDKEKK